LAVAVDVSAREQVERALRESESRFRSVANCLREAVLITDANDRIVLANDRVRDVLGHSPEDVLGRNATDLLLPAGQQNAFRDRLRRRLDGESELYELELVRGDGRIIVAEVSASPYRDASGTIIGTLGAISDITSRKQLEERVRQSSRLEAVGQLAGGVAHDFNNLLTVIKVHAELLGDDLPKGDPLQHSVREIEGAANRAADVTGQLLAFSRRQLLQPRRLSLDHVVTEALPVLRKLAGMRVEIATSTDASLPSVFADPLQIENVLVTLVRNACEAMPRGGRIVIGTESRDLAARDLAFQNQHLPAGSYTVLWVTDTGMGMDGAVLRRLFEPFFTTKEVGAGTGMGLASMFGIVRQSGGFVDVQSAPGSGTTFTIYLPAIAVSAPPVEAASTT
jgi:PAS domain S-box-containing protein